MVNILNYKDDYYNELNKLFRNVHKQKLEESNRYVDLHTHHGAYGLRTKVLTINGRLVGYITYFNSFMDMFKNTLFVKEIYIQKPYDTCGNYKALLEKVRNFYILKRYKYARLSLVLECGSSNDDLISKLNLKTCRKLIEMKVDLDGPRPIQTNLEIKFTNFRNGIDENKRVIVQNSIFADTDGHIDCDIDDIISEENQDYYLEDGGTFIDVNGNTAGYSQVIFERYPNPRLYIVNFGLAKNFRNQGLGKLLLYHTLNMLYSKGFKEVYVTVNSNNTDAYNLYTMTGFQKTCNYYDCIYEY